MSNLEQAARQALEALENVPMEYDFHGIPVDVAFGSQLDKAVESLSQALDLDQPADWQEIECPCCGDLARAFPPAPKREWVGLTEEEIAQGNKQSWVTQQAFESAVWWAEAKLKKKNA